MTVRADPQPLVGARVISTRPRRQAVGLTHRLTALGASVFEFPAIEIVPLSRGLIAEAQKDVATTDFVIFVSVNAVDAFFAKLYGQWSKDLVVLAVGAKTAGRLGHLGVCVDWMPDACAKDDPYSSEALLALRRLQGDQIAGRRVVIVRGVGGRQLLGDVLVQRGARVAYAEVYERRRPQTDTEVVHKLLSTPPPVVIVTSIEGFENFYAIVQEGSPGPCAGEWLRECQYLALSSRIAERIGPNSIDDGPRHPAWIAEQASDEGLVAKLVECWAEVLS